MASIRILLLALVAIVAVQGIEMPNYKNFKPVRETMRKSKWDILEMIRPAKPESRIIGGSFAGPGQFKYQVALFLDSSSFCGGSLISNSWVLTAAHCASGVSQFVVMLGSISIEQGNIPGRVIVQSNQGYPHPGFDRYSLQNDVALVRLPQPVSLSGNIGTVSLAYSDPAPGQMATISGWGKTSDSSNISQKLKFVALSVISNQECGQYYGGTLYGGNICCFGNHQKATCQGDSGGPLVYGGSQIGIVSFGGQSCTASPSAFTRVSYFRDWIRQTSGV